MPPTSHEIVSNGGGGGNTYRDIDELQNSNGLKAVFSQRARDGVITYVVVRVFQKFDDRTRTVEDSTTGFMTESLAQSHLEFLQIVLEHLEKLKAKRSSGELPFPEGGMGVAPRRRGRS